MTLKNLIGDAASGNILSFRQQFSDQMNNILASKIQYKTSEVPVNSNSNSNVNEEVAKEDDAEAEKKTEKNSDAFLFADSKVGIEKAKKIVDDYNETHENNKLIVRMFNTSEGEKMFVLGDKVARIQVKYLIKGVGGKLQK